MKNRLIILVIILLAAIPLSAQQYCGENNRFLFEVVNDSLAKSLFLDDGFHSLEKRMYDIQLTQRGDTTFLNTGHPSRISWSIISKTEAEEIAKKQLGIPVLVKFFGSNNYSVSPDYYMEREDVLLMDTHSHHILIPTELSANDYIIVVKNGAYARTFVPREECPHKNEYLLLDLSGMLTYINAPLLGQCRFDNFPVRITNDSIVPLDEKKNFECWIENGFRFPAMHRKTAEERPFFQIDDTPSIHLLPWTSIGYAGLLELRSMQRLIIEPENGYYRFSVNDIY